MRPVVGVVGVSLVVRIAHQEVETDHRYVIAKSTHMPTPMGMLQPTFSNPGDALAGRIDSLVIGGFARAVEHGYSLGGAPSVQKPESVAELVEEIFL